RSLIPLSRQHHNGLALCVLTARSLRDDTSAESVARLAKKVVDRYEIELANHFEIEERLLFPAIERYLGPQALVAELIAEHRAIEVMIEGLRQEPSETRLRDFGALLTRHIRREEGELFEDVQKRLGRDTLDSLGVEIGERAVQVCFEP
ncbi:MAG: hemerythrin domain-containing protein, partial [Bryobacteraceae bacterium]